MGNEGAALIAEAIMQSKHIVSLDMSTNCLSSEGAIALFKSLIFNETLVDLNLSS